MNQRIYNNISESQVEDALVSNLIFLKKLLKLDDDLKLISRQLRLKNGTNRIDILALSGNEIILVELKITKYYVKYLSQVNKYREELKRLQKNGEFIFGKIKTFLLVTEAKKKETDLALKKDIEIIIYEPLEILVEYFNKLSLATPFLKIRPNEYGVMSLGKINRSLKALYDGKNSEVKISKTLNLSKGSIHNHLRIGKEFGLVRNRNQSYFLTDLGDLYVQNLNSGSLIEILNRKQISILKEFIAKDPFYSSTVFGIYSIVESCFILSRNSYPIELNDLQLFFTIHSGKVNQWHSKRTIQTGTYTFINFATDLELLGKIGKQIVITPIGLNFILMLQLYKSIEMINSLRK